MRRLTIVLLLTLISATVASCASGGGPSLAKAMFAAARCAVDRAPCH